ncbi:MAG: glycosyltransferase [Candidatus Eiseniibacteriota bacterium]
MRIQGIVDNNVWPAMMGHTVRVWNLYKGLAQRKDVAHVRVIAALKSRERAVRKEARDGVEIVRLKPWHPSVSAWLERAGLAPHFMAAEGYRRFPGTFVRAWDARADVLEVDSLLLTPLLEHAPAGALRVYGSQNVEIEWFERVGPRLAQRERWAARLAALERRALEIADLTIAVSSADRDQFVARYGADASKIVVVENGFDAERLRPPTPEEKRGAREALGLAPEETGLLFLGTDFEHNRKAVADLFTHVVPVLEEAGARLWIVGGVSTTFRTRAESEGRGRVRAVPEQSDLTPYLWGADVGLNPVTTGAGSNVKLPNYLAAGLDVLSTPFGVRGFERLVPHVAIAPIAEFQAALGQPFPRLPGRAEALASYAWGAQANHLGAQFAERVAARGARA